MIHHYNIQYILLACDQQLWLDYNYYIKNWKVIFGDGMVIRQIQQNFAPLKFSAIQYYDIGILP